MRGMLVEKNNCANIYFCQSNYSKLAGWSLEAKREIHVYSYYICLYVGKKQIKLLFNKKRKGDLSIQLFCIYEDGNLHDD